ETFMHNSLLLLLCENLIITGFCINVFLFYLTVKLFNHFCTIIEIYNNFNNLGKNNQYKLILGGLRCITNSYIKFL
ncbi:hypothetical protein Z961_01580, partial [Clostridium haemolyticum NCTC 8350]